MRCEKHPDSDAVGKCVYCGRGVCPICKISYEHVLHCRECIEAGRIKRPGPPPQAQQPMVQPYPMMAPSYPGFYYPRRGAHHGAIICILIGIMLCFCFSGFFVLIGNVYDEFLLLIMLWIIEGSLGVVALIELARGKETGRKLGILVAIIGLPLGLGPGTLVAILALIFLLSPEHKRFLQWRAAEIARITGKGYPEVEKAPGTKSTIVERIER